MQTRQQKEDSYRSVFKISLLISLFLITVLFYLFPRFQRLPSPRYLPVKVKIYVSEIPVTRQTSRSAKPPPRRPGMGVPVVAEEPDLPEEIPIDFGSGAGENTVSMEGLPAEIPARPVLELYPDVSGISCKGYVHLLLLVNILGKIETVEVVENTTGSRQCLERAIRAAKKSLWQPARVGNKPVKSWVSKTYKFNLNK